MGVTLTAPGEALIARLQAQGQPLNIDTFLFALVEGQDHTLAPATTGAVPEGIVHTRAIPPEYRAYVNPNQVVYSALLGSDVGDFAFNWQGLYCSEHSTLIAVATFPALQKRAYNPGTNAPGNNLTRNFMLEFSGAQNITQITLEASVWQLDFTLRLKGMDERERLSNRDIYGRVAFLGDGWLLQKAGSTYAFQPGSGYVEGIRAGLDDALPALPDTLPCEVFLDVCMDMQGSDRVALAMPVFAPEGASPQDYSEGPPSSTRHYRERIAHIAADGTVTDWRGKLPSVFPEGGTAGDIIVMGEEGAPEWGAGIGVGADGTLLTSRAGEAIWEAFVVPQPYILCEFYTFRHPTPPPGFLARTGAVIANADRDYPAAYAYLQTQAGKQLCTTLAAWNALSTTAGGVGGVPWFVLDTAAKTIKLPDTRGDYMREAGYKSMTVGGWHTDKLQGHWHAFYSYNNSGEFTAGNSARRIYNGVANNVAGTNDIIRQAIADNANNGAPRIGDETQTRAHHLLGCVYLGGV